MLVIPARDTHTEVVTLLSLDTWVSLAALAAGLAGLYGALRRDMAEMRTEFKQDMAALRTEFKQDMLELRTDLKQDMAELRTDLKSDIGRLDDRVYSLAAGMTPPWEQRRAD